MRAKWWAIATAATLAVVLAGVAAWSSDLYVGGGGTPNYVTIQAAVTAAGSGDTIHVAAGTYNEQVNITKALTLSGAGMASTHIVSPSPATMVIYDAFGGKSPNQRYYYDRAAVIPVVRIAASDVVFENCHVDLNNYVFYDVLGSYPADTTYSKGGGILVDHVETSPGTPDVFTGIVIRNNKLDGFLLNDNADGIKVLGSATVTVEGNTIYAYGESGLAFHGVDLPVRGQYYPTVTANNNTIYGGSSGRGGGTGTECFFGIGYWFGATGSADGNTIYNYPDYSVGGPALNVWGSRPVSFTNNFVTSDGGSVGSWGVSLRGSAVVTLSNNTIDKQDRGVHIIGSTDGNPIVSMTSNTITNCNIATTIGTYTSGLVSPTVTATGNTISQCSDGIVVNQQKNGSVILRSNTFTGIAAGHYAIKVGGPAGTSSGTTLGSWYGPSAITVDATSDYWGGSGPSGGVADPVTGKLANGTGSGVSANVLFDPWYVDAAMTTLSNVVPTNVYVNSTYVDGNAGGHAFGYDAFTTIQAGINAVATGGMVHVAAGTYSEHLTIGKSLTLQGNSEPSPIIDGGGTGTALTIGASSVTVTGFTIQSAVTGIVATSGTGNAVHFCNIAGNTTWGVNNTSGNVFDATDNYWGGSGPSGGVADPVTGTLANGTGDKVSANVLFDPWTGMSTECVVTAPGQVQGNTVTNPCADTSLNIVEAPAGGTTDVTIAKYTDNPAGTPAFGAAERYIDVQLSNPAAVTELTIVFGDMAPGTMIYFYRPGTGWLLCSDQTYSGGSIEVKVRVDTVPTLLELTGGIFAEGSAPGDINGDGKKDVLDVRLCLQIATGFLQGTAQQRAAANVDGDGDVDLDDAEWLASYIIHIIEDLGAE